MPDVTVGYGKLFDLKAFLWEFITITPLKRYLIKTDKLCVKAEVYR